MNHFCINFEPILNQFWINFKPTLHQFNFESIFNQFLIDFESTLNQLCINFEFGFENHPVYFSVRPTIWKRLLLPCEAIMNNRLFWKLAWWYSIMVLRKDRREESLARKLHPLGSKCEISWWEWEEGKEPPFKNAYFCK